MRRSDDVHRAIREPEKCGLGDIRQMFEEYWTASALRSNPWEAGCEAFLDCELRVKSRIGARSWDVERSGRSAILQTETEGKAFEPNDCVRILGITASQDLETDALVLTETAFSESFVLCY